MCIRDNHIGLLYLASSCAKWNKPEFRHVPNASAPSFWVLTHRDRVSDSLTRRLVRSAFMPVVGSSPMHPLQGCGRSAVPGAATGASTVAPHPTARDRRTTLGSQHFGCHRPHLEHRTSRQNDGHRQPDIGAERHVRVRSRSASTLGVGQYAARSKPAIRDTGGKARRLTGLPLKYRHQCSGEGRWIEVAPHGKLLAVTDAEEIAEA